MSRKRVNAHSSETLADSISVSEHFVLDLQLSITILELTHIYFGTRKRQFHQFIAFEVTYISSPVFQMSCGEGIYFYGIYNRMLKFQETVTNIGCAQNTALSKPFYCTIYTHTVLDEAVTGMRRTTMG